MDTGSEPAGGPPAPADLANGVQVRIHCGATEIGGSCVEIRCGSSTILIDLGKPLWAGRDDVIPLPGAVGLGEPGPAPLAVVLSHGHQDHWGLVPQLPDGVPVCIGEGAADVLRAAEYWGTGVDLHESGTSVTDSPSRSDPSRSSRTWPTIPVSTPTHC